MVFFLLLDLYIFQALKAISYAWSPGVSKKIFFSYWILSFSSVATLIAFMVFGTEMRSHLMRNYIFAIIACLFFAKFLSGVFFLIDDLRRAIQYMASVFVPSLKPVNENGGISRSVFLSWMGFVTGGGLMGSLLYGFGNKYRYTVKNIRLQFPNLPKVFKGFKLVHISDIHSGSFNDPLSVKRGIELINQQQPDLILFTGDLVNYQADEMSPYINLFRTLQAPYGVYATLGNHDYGFHGKGIGTDIRQIHKENADAVERVHQKLGWKLLRNKHVILKKETASVALIGVENISAKSGFPSYGDLISAYSGTKSVPFKILMSHDPSHWNAEVTSIFKDIDLTLSGHTHGMQFGVEIPGFRWSPVKYLYKQWAGLYEQGDQKLYVNRGFGFIGYPGRVGILPEITVIELS
jgi:predicted MPP superfamily phosphohydrolase